MLRLFNNHVPRGVRWTLGRSPLGLMNGLRLVGAVERRLALRHLTRLEDGGDGYDVLQARGVKGCLYVSQELPRRSLFQTFVEQLYPWHWHYYQIPQTRIGPEDVVLDCGCAEGCFTFLNKERAREIHAFEPLPAFVRGLERSFAGTANIKIVPAALAEEPGTAYLREEGIMSGIVLEPTPTTVQVESLDHYCAEQRLRPTYLKADLEGFEMNVLQGAANVIRENKPRVAITTYHRKEHAQEITDWLRRLNPDYRFLLKGICRHNANPIMLHAW